MVKQNNEILDKTLDEVIFDILKECGETFRHSDNKPCTREETMDRIKKMPCFFYCVPKEELPLVYKMWKVYYKKYSNDSLAPFILPPISCEKFGKDVYGLVDDISALSHVTDAVIKKCFDRYFKVHKIHDSINGISYTSFVKDAARTILCFREDESEKRKEVLSIWTQTNHSGFVEILEQAKQQREAWRKAEMVNDPVMQDVKLSKLCKECDDWENKTNEYKSKLSEFVESTKNAINDSNKMVADLKKTILVLYKKVTDLETEEDLKSMKINELDDKLKDYEKESYKKKIGEEYMVKIVRKALIGANNWSQQARQKKYDQLSGLLLLKDFPDEARDMIEALQYEVSQENGKRTEFNINQLNIGNGTQNTQLPSPEDNK